MFRLTKNKIDLLERYLQESGIDKQLFPELLDHLACEAEERLWEGESIDEVLADISGAARRVTLFDLNLSHKHLLAMNSTLDEIVFEGRNKAYGAYVLRRDYATHVQKAFLLGVGIFLSLVFLPKLLAMLSSKAATDKVAFVHVNPEYIKTEETPKPEVLPPSPPPAAPAVKMTKMLPPEVMTNPVEDTPPPTIEQLSNAQISDVNQEGVATDIPMIVPPIEDIGTGKAKIVEAAPEEKEYMSADQQPEFVNGQAALVRFLQNNLKYPRAASNANTQGKVIVQFSVMSDGSIANVSVLKGIGFGCDEEAERVVKMMPKWKPGKQNGKPVRVRFTLPIQFALQE